VSAVADSPYQVMPPLTAEEYAALKASIAERGILVPVVLDQHGNIIDGHYRLQVAAELGITIYDRLITHVEDEDQARSLARVHNLTRRHLSRAQRRQLIGQEIEANPDRSDREIGRLLGVDHKTVGSVRREIRGELPHAWLDRILAEPNYGPYRPHPFLDVFPLVPVDHFAGIAQSIKQHGLILPITLNHDRTVLVDGRIRYLACGAVHVEPHYKVLGKHYDERRTLDYIRSMNLVRQNFTPDQCAIFEAELGEHQAVT
jgi:ParB-like chromosome segregation protein Spo0J